jgi:hypothetical protein
MKPNLFFNLPGALQESLLWDMELDYDPYESSKAQAIHEIMLCDNLSCVNGQIIVNAYKFMDEEMLIRRAQSIREGVVSQLNSLDDFLRDISKNNQT